MSKNSTTKKSFVLYVDMLDVLEDLTDEQAGQLFKAIRDYHNDVDPVLTQVIKPIFRLFSNQLARDAENWALERERRREAGRKGGLAKASNAKQHLANLAVNVNVNDNVKKQGLNRFNPEQFPRPGNQDGWQALAKKYNIDTRPGEGWHDFEARVRKTILRDVVKQTGVI